MANVQMAYLNATQQAEIQEAIAAFKSGGSVLRALAVVMGVLADKMTDDIFELARKVDGDKKNETALSTELSIATQKLTILMNGIDNAMKTIGTAQAKLSSKG